MKKSMKTLLCTIVLCAVMVTALVGKEVKAATKAPVCAKTQTVYCYDSYLGVDPIIPRQYRAVMTYTRFIYIKNLASNAKVTNVKSSNPKISPALFRGFSQYDMDAIGFNLTSSKKGLKDGEKAKITFKVKQNGKTYNLSCTLTFKKSKTPFKTLKFGTKEYTSLFNGSEYKKITFPKKKFKFTYAPASGMVIDFIYVNYENGTRKKVKSGTVLDGRKIRSMDISYHTTKKPANYVKPRRWNDPHMYIKSPLHEAMWVINKNFYPD